MEPVESSEILTVSPPTDRVGGPGVPVPRTRVELPWPTVAKAVLVLVVAVLVLRLVGLLLPILLELVIALLLTATLTPPVAWLVRRGVPRLGAVALVLIGIVAALALLIALIAPPLVDEGRALAAGLPGYVDRAQGLLRRYPDLESRLRAAASTGAAQPGSLVPVLLTAGTGLVTGTTDAIAVVVMTAYLLAGGERSLAYLLSHLPPNLQAKTRRAAPAVVRVVSGYMLGQVVTSALFGVFAFAVCFALDVPQPLLLALLAAVLDAVPILGVLVATAVPVLLALTVSPTTAVIVLVAFVAYHQIESHVLVPRIYGRAMGISSLAVLIAVLVGYRLIGILGVLIALPLAAAVPAVERAWRQDDLLAGVALRHGAEAGTDRAR